MTVHSRKGFTLIELLIVIGIIAILSTTAVIKFKEWYENYKFLEEVSKLEYVIRRAKVIALEESKHIKVRANGNNLIIEDCGFDYNYTSCSPLFSYRFNYNLESTRTVTFSPRGLAHSFGSFCLSKEGMSYKVIVNRAGIRVEKGGTC